MSKGCENCGYNENPVALVFAHIDQMTKSLVACGYGGGNGISRLYVRICYKDMKKNTKYIKELFEEIRKCKILCQNCHSIETDKNKESSNNHEVAKMRRGGQKNEEQGSLEEFFVDSF